LLSSDGLICKINKETHADEEILKISIPCVKRDIPENISAAGSRMKCLLIIDRYSIIAS
jgi:hypothetical protein